MNENPHGSREGSRMTVDRRQFYKSSNDDRWYLARDPGAGRVFVQHQGNAPSGAHKEEIELSRFLDGDIGTPERQALLRLIGSFIDERAKSPELERATIPVEGLNTSNDK